MVDLKNSFQLVIDHLIYMYELIMLNCNASINYAFVVIEYYYKFVIRNMLFYLFPIESVCVFNLDTNCIEKFNLFNSSTSNKYYITKFHNVKHNNWSFTLNGHIYHTSENFCMRPYITETINDLTYKKKLQYLKSKEIENIKIIYESIENNTETNCIAISKYDKKPKWTKCSNCPNLITDILSNISEDANIIIIIYYYMQTYLKENIIINNIKITYEIDSDLELESESESDTIKEIDLNIKEIGLFESNRKLKRLL